MQKPEESRILRIRELSEKILEGTITEVELLEFDVWYTSFDDHLVDSFSKEQLTALGISIYDKIKVQRKNSNHIFIKKIAQCAAVILIMIVGAWFYHFYINHDRLSPALKNQAFIQDKEGNLTAIDSLMVGQSQQFGSLTFTKKEDGLIEFKENSEDVHAEEVVTMVTPKGGENRLKLPDGTLVWMNANSKIEFKAAFSGKERRVSISGEAYFEVNKDTKRPFIVTTDVERIKVLGTKFNVSAYHDDEKHITSLTEGKVIIEDKETPTTYVQLIPGQQAIKKEGNLTVRNFDPNEVLGWKNGEFVFNQTSLGDVSKVLGRWYDVEFDFSDPVLKEIPIWGTLSKKESLPEILSVLQRTQVARFEIKEGRVMVRK